MPPSTLIFDRLDIPVVFWPERQRYRNPNRAPRLPDCVEAPSSLTSESPTFTRSLPFGSLGNCRQYLKPGSLSQYFTIFAVRYAWGCSLASTKFGLFKGLGKWITKYGLLVVYTPCWIGETHAGSFFPTTFNQDSMTLSRCSRSITSAALLGFLKV